MANINDTVTINGHELIIVEKNLIGGKYRYTGEIKKNREYKFTIFEDSTGNLFFPTIVGNGSAVRATILNKQVNDAKHS